MILNMFAVFDVKSDAYLTPFFFPTRGQAVRAFKDLANDPNTTIGRHPEDYKLVHLAEYDDSTGAVGNVAGGYVSLGFATDYIDRAPSPIKAVS